MAFDEQDGAINGELETIVENCFIDESIRELDVNVVSMEKLCATPLYTL